MVDSVCYVYLTQDLSSEKRKGLFNLSFSDSSHSGPQKGQLIFKNHSHMWLLCSQALQKKNNWTFIKHFRVLKSHCAECFVYISSSKKLSGKHYYYPHFEDKETDIQLKNLPKVTQLVSGRIPLPLLTILYLASVLKTRLNVTCMFQQLVLTWSYCSNSPIPCSKCQLSIFTHSLYFHFELLLWPQNMDLWS